MTHFRKCSNLHRNELKTQSCLSALRLFGDFKIYKVLFVLSKVQARNTTISRFCEIGFKISIFSWSLEYPSDHQWPTRSITGVYRTCQLESCQPAGWCMCADICLNRSWGAPDIRVYKSVTKVYRIKMINCPDPSTPQNSSRLAVDCWNLELVEMG